MKKILIVEDVAMNVDLLVQTLVIAGDGAQAATLAEQERPDLILLDMSLPVMDGWEVTQRIEADRQLRRIPIIGLSTHAMSGDAEKAPAAGCDDYLTKPLNDKLLFQKLERWLNDPAGERSQG